MTLALLIFFVIYAFSVAYITRWGLVKQFQKERDYNEQIDKINVADITVLIPFRNEADRFDGLIESINKANVHPKRYIFIDDHSTDRSVQVLREGLRINNYEIVQSPEGSTGKKRAIRTGAEHVDSIFTLTLDADVLFAPDFFEELGKLGRTEMYVLPAILKAKRWYEHFYEIDVLLVTAANAGLSGLSRPIMASGANLLYKTKTFNKVDNLESHEHMASGDDTYLLRDFRESNSDVRLHTNPKVAVSTETPQSFKEFIDQRLRWIGKTGDIKDNLSTTLAVSQSVLTVGFLGMLIWAAVISDWVSFVKLIGIKAFLDLSLFGVYFVRMGRIRTLFFIPIYEIIFPLYTILLIVLMVLYKPKWKGREINIS